MIQGISRNIPIQYDKTFRQTITSLYGERGERWLLNLPALAARLETQWQIELLPPFPLSYNYVAPAVSRSGQECVLKLAVPNPEFEMEIKALRFYGGRGMVRLLQADIDQGALLLERLRPGRMLVELGDDETMTRIAAGVMQRYWRPLPPEHGFKPVADWAAGLKRLRRRYDGGTGPLPSRTVERAERLFADLLASERQPVLLHGDLHHFNVLSVDRAGEQDWVAIDPKGVAGEREYEVSAFMNNPNFVMPFPPDFQRLLRRRFDIFQEMLALDRQRMIAWATAGALLSAFWSLEDSGEGWELTVALSDLLANL